MSSQIEINGRVRTISIEPIHVAGAQGGSFRVVIDGEPVELHARPTEVGLSLVLSDGRVVDAALTERAGGGWLVQLPHVSLVAVVDGRRPRGGAGGPAVPAGEQRVTAPMPGRVLRVLVKTGDVVAERQGLVVVEAMKMENEIGSPKAGRVKEVAVSEGLSIEAGRLLAVVE